MLKAFIGSYTTLDLPSNLTLSLEVVENDLHPNMESLVNAYPTSDERPIFYHLEPKLGIPCARNRCIDIALQRGATHIAFVDDDERFTPDWLQNIWLYSTRQQHKAVIQGVVLSQLDESISPVFKPFFQRDIPVTGTHRDMCITNNLLVPMSIFTTSALRFDESRPLAGGTDSKLFRQLHQRGSILVDCAEAIMYERITTARANIRWLTKRYFRIGLTLGEHRAPRESCKKIAFSLLRIFSSFKHAFKAAIYFFARNKSKRLNSWLKASKTLGVALGAYHLQIDSYRKIEGE